MSPKLIALYLPQFHPIPENEEWWGKGFTEWTNVGKAKPLWKGHDQPRVPADLGYYDLRLPEVREQQVELAREAGVTAFCYWHYWFGNGKRLLERVFDEVLESGKPDFPFCLGWANHSWGIKGWRKEIKKEIIIAQQLYPGIEDARKHFNYLLKAFKDDRYVKIDGKPFFLIFDIENLPEGYIQQFRIWAKEEGLLDLFIVANAFDTMKAKDYYIQKGANAVVYNRITSIWTDEYVKIKGWQKPIKRIKRFANAMWHRKPIGAIDYKDYCHNFITIAEKDPCVIPEIVPQWDHSPRTGCRSDIIYYNSTPESFYEHAKDALEAIKKKPKEMQIILVKSWNEWGEGNYMEPDLTHGKGYIDALRKALDEEMTNIL